MSKFLFLVFSFFPVLKVLLTENGLLEHMYVPASLNSHLSSTCEWSLFPS